MKVQLTSDLPSVQFIIAENGQLRAELQKERDAAKGRELLKQDLVRWSAENERLRGERDALAGMARRLVEGKDQLQARVKELEAERDQLRSIVASLNRQFDEQRDAARAREAECENYIDELGARNTELQARVKELEAERDAFMNERLGPSGKWDLKAGIEEAGKQMMARGYGYRGEEDDE